MSGIKKILQNDRFIGLALALVAFAVYLRTLAPSLTFIDSGELATVASTLGIAHPTGYPLFTLLTATFAHLPLGGRVIWKLNLFSALCCAVSVFLFYRLFLLLLSEGWLAGLNPIRETDRRKKNVPVKTEASLSSNQIAAATAALALAFSETFWSQAVSIEVYSLHLVFLALVVFLFARAMMERERGRGQIENKAWWYAFAFALGLSFTNHMTTILLAPGFLYFYFVLHGFSRASWKKIGRAVVPFLAGLSVYLYLPLRAAQNPMMNWGNPVTLERLGWHVSGKQFRVWMFSSFDSAGKQFAHFVSTFASEFGYLALLLALIGMGHLFIRSGRMLVFSLLLFFGCLLYSINYDIHDIDSYFLLAYATTAIWAAFGALTLLEFARKKGRLWIAGILCAACVAMPLFLNYRSVDESRDYAVEDYARNMLQTADSNAVILSYQWDAFVSAAYYLQIVENIRPDVTVIDKELLRRSWYYTQLGRRHPWLIGNSRTEVQSFLAELYKFEHDLPYDPGVIQARYVAVIRNFLAKSSVTRSVYVTPEIEQEFTAGFRKIPAGLAFRITSDTLPITVPLREYTFRPFPRSNPAVERVKDMYALAYVNQGVYRAMQGDRTRAISLVQKALAVKPGYGDALAWLDRLGGTPR